MADSYSCSINTEPNATGNMYFKGEWQFCPEYRTGDVVIHNGVMYLCKQPHAGQEPSLEESADYWYAVNDTSTDTSAGSLRRILDGGFASTSGDDKYDATIDGGTSSERVHIPLI